jgi:hypothetical protein
MLSLRELQTRIFAALHSDGDGSAAPLDLVRVVNGRGALGPAERLDIYAGMYGTRLLDVLREDFPRTLGIVGDDAFAALARRYLARFPSTNASVRHLGHRFAGFLATEPTVPEFLADLARLEWARVEVFDAADASPLRLADLQSVSADRWPDLRFRLIPACVVMESAWPVHRIWADASALTTSLPAPEPTVVRVWRENWSVSHAAIGLAERRALRALQDGGRFAEICAAVATDLGPEAAAHAASGILVRWLEDELLAWPDPPVRMPE